MRILIAGASGAIGRALVRRLRAVRHQVFALTRSPDSVPGSEELGTEAVLADARDAAAVKAAIARIRALDPKPAFLIHTGDLTHAQKPGAFDIVNDRIADVQDSFGRDSKPARCLFEYGGIGFRGAHFGRRKDVIQLASDPQLGAEVLEPAHPV